MRACPTHAHLIDGNYSGDDLNRGPLRSSPGNPTGRSFAARVPARCRPELSEDTQLRGRCRAPANLWKLMRKEDNAPIGIRARLTAGSYLFGGGGGPIRFGFVVGTVICSKSN